MQQQREQSILEQEKITQAKMAQEAAVQEKLTHEASERQKKLQQEKLLQERAEWFKQWKKYLTNALVYGCCRAFALWRVLRHFCGLPRLQQSIRQLSKNRRWMRRKYKSRARCRFCPAARRGTIETSSGG